MRAIEMLFFLSLFFMGPALMAAAPMDSLATQPPMGQKSPESLLGFKEWKQNRVLKARSDLEDFKSPNEENVEKSGENSEEIKWESNHDENQAVEVKVSEASNINKENKNPAEPDLRLEERAEKLRQLEFNLEIAQGLTIHDYFALYLKDKSREEMARVIEKLSSDELSELLLAYRASLYGLPVPGKDDSKPFNQNL